MSRHEHLEIISPNGEVVFHDLDAGRGVTNIGSHPENDVVIDAGGIAPFHAVLDHRQKPYQLVLLSEDGNSSLRGERLTPNVATDVHDWDSIELDGYTVILTAADGPADRTPTAAPQSESLAVAPPAAAQLQQPASTALAPRSSDAPPQQPQQPRPPATTHETRPPAIADDVILVEVEEREWTVDVENSVSFDVTITNGGGIVATFETSVDGLDATWVTVSEPQVNLYEGDRTAVTITITPPRAPTSRAGEHHFAVVVTSPNHPERRGQVGATLTLSPYYEFAVGDVSPKQQTVSWHDNTGEIVLPVHNRSNSEATFQLAGEDDERACRVEFSLPGEGVTLARQAELQLAPDEAASVPISITPLKRRLIGLRKRDYSFTITTSMLEGQTTPRTVMGQLKSKPLIGPLLIGLIALTLAVIVILVFRPRIYDFNANDMLVTSVDADNSATLSWRASRFAGLRIEPDIGSVDGPEGQATVIPDENTTYTLTAGNWLSGINRSWFSDDETVRVIVTPVPPNVRVFRADREHILTGESATLFWDVVDAEEVKLSSNESTISTDPNGQQEVSPGTTTTYELVAGNKFDTQTRRITIRVDEPTPTPVPEPIIRTFVVNPREVIEGERITVEWQVDNAERVVLSECGIDNGPDAASIVCTLDQTTELELVAFNGDKTDRALQSVNVNPKPTETPEPTATPEPQPPIIDLFKITPDEIPFGDDATMNWSVSGEYTDIEISGPPDFGINGVYPVITDTGSITVTAEETALFILRAFNGDLKAEVPAELNVVPPTPTPEPSPTPEPPPTPVPLPNIVYFKAEGEKTRQVGDTTYEVEAGSEVTFSWLVQRASKATFVGLGDQPFEGQLKRTMTEPGNTTYQLVAENDAGKTVDAFIQIELKPIEPPPAPTNVGGETLDDSKNRIEWQYVGSQEIEGFRVYRSIGTASGDYVQVAGEDDLGPNVRNWVDEEAPSCGKSYYVVAVYFDIVSGENKESAPSTTTWASLPCDED